MSLLLFQCYCHNRLVTPKLDITDISPLHHHREFQEVSKTVRRKEAMARKHRRFNIMTVITKILKIHGCATL